MGFFRNSAYSWQQCKLQTASWRTRNLDWATKVPAHRIFSARTLSPSRHLHSYFYSCRWLNRRAHRLCFSQTGTLDGSIKLSEIGYHKSITKPPRGAQEMVISSLSTIIPETIISRSVGPSLKSIDCVGSM